MCAHSAGRTTTTQSHGHRHLARARRQAALERPGHGGRRIRFRCVREERGIDDQQAVPLPTPARRSLRVIPPRARRSRLVPFNELVDHCLKDFRSPPVRSDGTEFFGETAKTAPGFRVTVLDRFHFRGHRHHEGQGQQ